MAKYRVISTGNVIVANAKFMDAVHPADYELIPEPEVIAETHYKSFTTTQLNNSFTSAEAIASLASTNPIVKAQAELLAVQRDKTITFDDPGYISAITDLLNEGIFDSDTYDSYLQGVPLDRL